MASNDRGKPDRTARVMTREDRTTDIGLYHYARSYRASADHLRTVDLGVTHPRAPIQFLYFHAIELYLKSFLRLHGLRVSKLQDIGHKACCLANEAEARGFRLTEVDRGTIYAMASSNAVIRSRYIVTGAYQELRSEVLAQTTSNFHGEVRDALREAGKPVRD